MNIAQIREALLWCVILNIGLVTVWSILVLVAKGWLNGILLKWFRVSAEHCGMINLTGIVLYKVGNILFFLVPPRRKSLPKAMILPAVAAAFPGTISLLGT
jgi:hypothetical protein